MTRRASITLCVAALFCSVAPGQDYRAKVQGLVLDSSEAAVPGARLTLRNINTGVENVQLSNATGQYVFSFVEPGSYTLGAELAGFSKFIEENIQVQTRADVTVNVKLRTGSLQETVTVSDSAASLQFNTSTMELTVNRKMLTDLPILARNPFTLALLDPAVVNRHADIRNPFFMWASSQLDVGGSTSTRNDLLLDGAPLQFSNKGSYSPPMDAVQEFSVQQNSVDAEFGHSSGGILSLSTKSGTNELHGTAYYFGRNPKLNAVSNSVTHTRNQTRNHIWGGSAGGPIRKNKVFTFGSFERWNIKDPRDTLITLPTDLERTGDFSQTLNSAGGLATIYDPTTTLFDAAAGTVTRTPFPGNRISPNRQDQTALRFLKDIWRPNGPGDDLTHVNNYKTSFSYFSRYWNFSNRTDWNISDKWKMFARYSRFHTQHGQNNYANSPALSYENAGIMHSRNIAADTVYTVNSSTVLNFRGSYSSLNDDYGPPGAAIQQSLLSEFWPNNSWYTPYLKDLPALYYPNLIIGGTNFGKGQFYWQHPRNYSWHGRISKNVGPHSLKAGLESRLRRGDAIRPNLMNFNFSAALTADTSISPNTKLRGNPWATFLIGALGSDSQAQYIPIQSPETDFYGTYFHDDIKLTRNLTLNLGIRYEYETAPRDPSNRLSRYLDLTNPIPEMQSNPPKIPADIAGLMPTPYRFNGAWIFTDGGHRRMWESAKLASNFMPRIGVAYRINEKTSLRAGYARYIVPPLLVIDTLGSLPYPGYNARTAVAPVLEGLPGARLSDPFPAANPLIVPAAKQYGRYTTLGDNATWTENELRTGVNDRLNVTLQRQLPGKVQAEITFFANYGHNLPYAKQANLSDPQLSYTYKSALDQRVSNPFFQYLTPDTFPGQLRNQASVTRGSLLRPYPQYLGLTQTNTHGVLNRYRSLQIKSQRAFSKGFFFLAAYNYNRERNYGFFNADDEYASRFTFQPSDNARHRLTLSGSYDLPFGKGRPFLSNAHPLLNAVLGGWSASSLFFFNSGQFLRFGPMLTTGDPRIDHPTRTRYFDTSKFQQLPPYSPRSNPWQYDGLTGPRYWNIDSSLAKFFPIRERFRLEFKMEVYNLTNSFIANDPNTDVLSSLFGRITNQVNRGREMQYTIKLHF